MLMEATLVASLVPAQAEPALEPRLECASPASAEARREAEELYRRGAEALGRSRFEDALPQLTRAVELDPALALAQYGLGEAYLGVKDYVQAVRSFSRSREAFRCEWSLPDAERKLLQRRLDDEIRELRGAIRSYEQRRAQEGMVEWKEVNGNTATPPEKLRAQRGLEERLELLERVRKRRDPAPLGVTLALGTAHFHAGSMPDAEREFRAVLAADPRSGDAHNNLAVVLMLDGRLAEAEREAALAGKHGTPVDPRLKQEIERRKRARPEQEGR